MPVTKTLDELIDAARRTPPDLSFEEFEVMLSRLGWTWDRSYGDKGDVWMLDPNMPLTIEPDSQGRPRKNQVRIALEASGRRGD